MGTRPTPEEIAKLRKRAVDSRSYVNRRDAVALLAEIDALTDERDAAERSGREGGREMAATIEALTARAEAAEGKLAEAEAALVTVRAHHAEGVAALRAQLAEAQAAVEGLREAALDDDFMYALACGVGGAQGDQSDRCETAAGHFTAAVTASATHSTAGRRALEEAREAGARLVLAAIPAILTEPAPNYPWARPLMDAVGAVADEAREAGRAEGRAEAERVEREAGR